MNINQHNTFGNNNISFGTQQRALTVDLRSSLLSMLNRNETVKIVSSLGDGEANIFAEEIKQFLLSNNYTVNGVDLTITIPPMRGQMISPGLEDGVRLIRIGHQ